MPAAFASGNSTFNSGPQMVFSNQQPGGSFSNGQFAIDNLSASLSQLSPVGSYENPGFTSSGGSEVYPILGYMGPSNMSSMVNLVRVGDTDRSLSSGGGSYGFTPRLNLMGHSRLRERSVQGSDRSIGGMLSQAPQVTSVAGNSYSASGDLLSRDHLQSENNHLASIASLNRLVAHENASSDIINFPQLTGHPNSAAHSLEQPGLLRNQSIGIFQKNREFNVQNEEFPALPRFKGGNTDYPVDLHQKEQFHDTKLLMMQPPISPMGRSAGFSLGEPNPSPHQKQHEFSINGSRASLLHLNSPDFLHSHDSGIQAPANASYHSQVQRNGPSSNGVRPKTSPNTVPGHGPYNQLIQRNEQLQDQSLLHLWQMSAVGPNREKILKSPQASQAVADRFSLLGLVTAIKMGNPGLVSLALGFDLTSLGLNMNSSDSLHQNFSSPWSEKPTKGEPQYDIPKCYLVDEPLELHQVISKVQAPTLFYIFYSMPKEEAQLYAANELNNRGWFYHRELRLWLTRETNLKPLVKTDTYERGSYHCFDPNSWTTIRKDNFILEYDLLEKRPILPHH